VAFSLWAWNLRSAVGKGVADVKISSSESSHDLAGQCSAMGAIQRLLLVLWLLIELAALESGAVFSKAHMCNYLGIPGIDIFV
jgi:hypothetical protein